MDESIQATEAQAQNVAAEQPKAVELNQSHAAEIDYAAEYEALLEENKRLASDRDNYRKGMLSAKSKLKTMPEPEEGEEADEIDRRIQAALEAREESQKLKRQEEIARNLIKQNRELKVALQNRAQVSSAPSGASDKSSFVKEKYFTDEQLAYFKKRGLDPEKVRTNLEKNKK